MVELQDIQQAVTEAVQARASQWAAGASDVLTDLAATQGGSLASLPDSASPGQGGALDKLGASIDKALASTYARSAKRLLKARKKFAKQGVAFDARVTPPVHAPVVLIDETSASVSDPELTFDVTFTVGDLDSEEGAPVWLGGHADPSLGNVATTLDSSPGVAVHGETGFTVDGSTGRWGFLLESLFGPAFDAEGSYVLRASQGDPGPGLLAALSLR